MPSQTSTIILLVAVAVALFIIGRGSIGLEGFMSAEVPMDIALQEHAQDVRVVASYVGPYIGEIYAYLRTMYSDPSKDVFLPPLYQPTSDTDATLQDPLLPIARTQVKAWIDSAKTQMANRYGDAFLTGAKLRNDLRYEEQASNVLHVILTQDGKSQTFIL